MKINLLLVIKKFKKLILTFIVFIEISAVIFLFIYISKRQNNVLGKAIIAPINKKSVITNKQTDLKYFYEPKPNSIDRVNEWSPYKGKYTINSDSLNERFDYEVKKSGNIFRIITLGDSYTYGLYVDTPDNWPEQLEELLNSKLKCRGIDKFEVINLGVHGYDIQYEAERFRLRGLKYNADLLLWLIKSDDLLQVNEVMGKKLASYPPSPGYGNWSRAMKEAVDELGVENIYALQQTHINNFLQTYPNRVVFLTFPFIRSFTHDLIKETVNKYKEKSDILYLDDIYKNKDNYYKDDQHPTVKGYKIMAENVFEYLKNAKTLSCN